MLILLGKTCSGKDTIVESLCKSCGFKKLITYTTRPMRDGEIQDVTYHFISEMDFKQKIAGGFFAEWKAYEVVEGNWYYGMAYEDLVQAEDNTVVILTPKGYKDIYTYIRNSEASLCLCACYIEVSEKVLWDRLNNRKDNPVEARRRMCNDRKDFSKIKSTCDFMVDNNGRTTPDEIAKTIQYFYNRRIHKYNVGPQI